jgi:hypothetical protein
VRVCNARESEHQRVRPFVAGGEPSRRLPLWKVTDWKQKHEAATTKPVR